MRRFLLLFAVFFCIQPLQAQIQVGLEIKRKFLMVYEPIIVTVTVNNLAGRDVTLADSPTQSWFGFQVNRADGQLVPPINPDYKLSPLTIPAGQSIKRSIVLNSIYPVRELGLYRVRAIIYFAAMDKYFQSQLINLELSEGKTIWQQTVGVPEGVEGAGGTRKLSLLSFRQAEYTMVYVRIEDVDAGTVFATTALGRVIAGLEPDAQVDLKNNLHVLQVAGAKTYLYSCLGLNGDLLSQSTYYAVKTRPTLRKDASGMITVVGGDLQPEGAAANKMKKINKLSDRPVQIPKE
ncbi:MAG: hypothetical protein NTZ46_10215 [Verrucomicrobia bacterium]|nr:hypothetical protein [Verrucomicrobiota bacterium]